MSQKSRKICLFLSNWIGDVIMSTPSIRRLHEALGDEAELTILGRPHLLDLLAGNPWTSRSIPFDAHGMKKEYRQNEVVRTLRQEQFDGMVLFPNSFRSAMIARLGGARQRIGYGIQWRSLMLTHNVKPPEKEIPLVDYYLDLAEAAIETLAVRDDYQPPSTDAASRYRLELRTTPEEEKLGDEIQNNLGLRDPEKVVILNVGSSNSPARSWPIDYAAELSRMIEHRLDMDVLLNCGPGEIGTVREIVEKSRSPRVFSLADQPLSIHTGKICIKRARLTVSTDSGPVHMALGFGNPGIVLRGPTSDTYTANPSADLNVVSRNLSCSPCFAKKQCPEKHRRCMLEITPELVFEKVVEVLEHSNRSH